MRTINIQSWNPQRNAYEHTEIPIKRDVTVRVGDESFRFVIHGKAGNWFATEYYSGGSFGQYARPTIKVMEETAIDMLKRNGVPLSTTAILDSVRRNGLANW